MARTRSTPPRSTPNSVVSFSVRALVAVQTVYFVSHTKTELLRAVADAAVIGVSDPRPPNLAEWYQAAVNAADPEQALAAFAAGVATILDCVGPLTPVLACSRSRANDCRASRAY